MGANHSGGNRFGSFLLAIRQDDETFQVRRAEPDKDRPLPGFKVRHLKPEGFGQGNLRPVPHPRIFPILDVDDRLLG